jgi:hypothetical protein
MRKEKFRGVPTVWGKAESLVPALLPLVAVDQQYTY